MFKKNSIRVLYLWLLRYVYGIMESVIVWYDLYTKTFKSHELALNTYDRSIKNSIIDGNNCTIYWYVDNNKLLHFDGDINTKIIDKAA